MNNPSNMPHHVAIIMDGNGRWATQRGLPKIAGHRQGVKTVQDVTKAAMEMGIKVLTLYAFSTENWKRPRREVDALFGLLEIYLEREADKLNKNNIRLSVIGRIKELPALVQEKLRRVSESTKNNTGLILNLALNYGGRAEIVDASRKIAQDVSGERIAIDDIDEAMFSRYLYTENIPDPDLLIRTSGEFRISNFLLWQICYAELYVTTKLWPDFNKDDLKRALMEYRRRNRRFGG
ncbi:MAG: di-trans,poly-cis-decaprenylcistransferase [Omnitrophica bacterium RIFCSPLOWO2_01_FULL_45_10]|nr:MAG: di-trans,poly-cis-decaprenylcistransferase [Omnitrophica bacterium RIFCSPLOWO2_01_FULL_45_10]